jgi:hypothetical protein
MYRVQASRKGRGLQQEEKETKDNKLYTELGKHDGEKEKRVCRGTIGHRRNIFAL